MPRVGQIIPEYLVPHVKTYINDNTTFEEAEVTAADPNVRLLCLFASDKGSSQSVKQIKSTTQFVKEYGKPNFEKYGQAALMPYAALSSGNATCWCLRVTDDEATHANFYVTTQTAVTEKAEGVDGKCSVAFIHNSIAKLQIGTAGSITKALDDAVPDDDTTLFGVSLIGPGKAGNSYRIRIVPDLSSTKQYGSILYTFEVIDTSSGAVSVEERFTVSFDPNSNTTTELRYADDVINDPEKGSSIIRIVTNPAGFKKLYDDYVSAVNPKGKATVEPFATFDLLNGTNGITNAKVTGYALDTTIVAEPVAGTTVFDNFGNVSGVEFKNGSDGKFDPEYIVKGEQKENGEKEADHKITETERMAAINKAYTTVLNAEKKPVPAIFSKRRTPAEYIFDAAFNPTVKSSLVELALHRFDAQLILDAGIDNTTFESIKSFAESSKSDGYGQYTNYIISKECQWYKIRDPFTQKIVPVSYTYHLASALPTHVMRYGNQTPYVGDRYATLTGHVYNTVMPEIDADDLDKKETLYNLGVNFVETVADNTYVHAVQTTAQAKTKNSDLSEMNNVAVLLDMKRRLENYVNANLYNFAEAEDRRRFTEDANLLFATYPGNKVRDYSVYFDMNEYEETRSILHCYLAVTFRQLAKRGIIEIDINKRS